MLGREQFLVTRPGTGWPVEGIRAASLLRGFRERCAASFSLSSSDAVQQSIIDVRRMTIRIQMMSQEE